MTTQTDQIRSILAIIDSGEAGTAAQLASLQGQLDVLHSQLSVDEATIATLNATQDALRQQVASGATTIAAKDALIADLQAQVADLQAQLDALNPEPPAPKIYYGASVSGGDPTALENSVGGKLGSYRSYFQASNSPADLATRAQRDLTNGRYPVISTKVPSTWASCASGTQDQWFKDRVQAMNTLGKPVAFCLHHEPENDLGTGMQASDFKAMYLHYKPIVDQLAPNVLLTPIIMSGKYNPNFTPVATARLKYSDWIDPAGCHAFGVDGYNHWSPGTSAKWRTAAETFGPVLEGLHQLDSAKPIIWAEYGVRNDPANPGKSAQWMRDAYELCLANGVTVMQFFSSNLNVNDGGIAWTMTGEVLQAFSDILKESAHV